MEWQPVRDFPGYEVSRDGRVRSHRLKAPRILRPALSSDGYMSVALMRDGKAKTVRLHCIVAEAWIGPRPDGDEVDHIDTDRSNNRVSNLRYLSKAENLARAQARGTRKGRCNVTDAEAASILSMVREGLSLRKVVAETGRSRATVQKIVRTNGGRVACSR